MNPRLTPLAITRLRRKKYKRKRYDLAILDIMGVNGLKLLEESVKQGIPTVMLTAHRHEPGNIDGNRFAKGAISYLPKETLVDLDELLESLLGAHERGEPTWKFLFEKTWRFFLINVSDRNGKLKIRNSGRNLVGTYHIGRGIQQRPFTR